MHNVPLHAERPSAEDIRVSARGSSRASSRSANLPDIAERRGYQRNDLPTPGRDKEYPINSGNPSSGEAGREERSKDLIRDNRMPVGGMNLNPSAKGSSRRQKILYAPLPLPLLPTRVLLDAMRRQARSSVL